MASINNQATLRAAIVDWLNRSDLTTTQIDLFIEMGEARIYEILRIPPLEKLQAYSVDSVDSSITLPLGFIELISIKKTGEGTCSVNPSENTTRALCSLATDGIWTDSDKDDDIILSRVDEKAFANKKIKNAYIRVGNNILITDNDGEQIASGEYMLNYYKADASVGTLTGSATNTLVVGNSYVIQTIGSSTPQYWEDAGVPVGVDAVVGVSFTAIATNIAGDGTVKLEITNQFIIGSEYEMILYSALAIGSTFLGDHENESHYNEMFFRKVEALNEKEKRAALKGGSFSAVYSAQGI